MNGHVMGETSENDGILPFGDFGTAPAFILAWGANGSNN